MVGKWIGLVSLLFMVLCILVGGYGLYRNSSNVMAYAMLGLGLGGLIAIVGLLFNRSHK